MTDITLYQFAGSHFNEKARWALDLKGVDHERVSLMPGPHAPRMKKLTGRTDTPVLVDGEEVVAGSTAIGIANTWQNVATALNISLANGSTTPQV